MPRKKGYYDLSEAEKRRVRSKDRERRIMERETGYSPKGRAPSYSLGLLFGGTPQNLRRGFSKTFGKPKTTKARSEFRLGVLDSYIEMPHMKPKKRRNN